MAVIRSMLLYGCEAWSILANRQRKRIQNFQNKCLKTNFNVPRCTRLTALQNVANLPYIDVLLENRVQMMFSNISPKENPLVWSVGQHSQQRAKYRNFFQGVLPKDLWGSGHQSED